MLARPRTRNEIIVTSYLHNDLRPMIYRVLHILGTAAPESAGIVLIVSNLAKGLAPLGFESHVCFLGADGPLSSELRAAGHGVTVLNWSNGIKDPMGAMRFARSLAGRRFSIIHQHQGGRMPMWIAKHIAGGRTIRHVWSHLNEAKGLEQVPFVDNNVDVIIACSTAVSECVTGRRIETIYAGIDADEYNLPELGAMPIGKPRVIGTAGRLVPMKGMSHLIGALTLVRDDFPDLELEIAGAGPLLEDLQADVNRLHLASSVRFLGWVPKISPLFRNWTIYVQPSVIEPFGIAALEAMAAGLPVIGTSNGGLREIIDDGKTGMIVPPGDSAALAKAITVLLRNPEMMRRIGQAGQERAASKFSTSIMVGQMARIYGTLLTSPTKRSTEFA